MSFFNYLHRRRASRLVLVAISARNLFPALTLFEVARILGQEFIFGKILI